MPEQNISYSFGAKALFCLLWVVGLSVFLLFAPFAILLVVAAPLVAFWNMLIAFAEAYLLFKSAQHFRSKDKPISELLLQVALAAIGVPLLASGGCLIIGEMGKGLRIAG